MEPRMDTDEMRVEAHNHSADHPSLICTANLRNHCGVRRISGSLPGGAASRDCGAAAQKRIQRRCSKAMHAEHADTSVLLQDRRSCIRYRRTRVAGIEPQAAPRHSPHRRVLRASPFCICAEILALRCRGLMLAHPLPGARRRTRIWRYMILARRVYGTPFLLRPTVSAQPPPLNRLHSTVMVARVPATRRDRLSLPMAGTCPA
jgi:hypothetical protein